MEYDIFSSPFVSDELTGDGCLVINCKNTTNILVIDVGGHGSKDVAQLRQNIINKFQQITEENLLTQLKTLSQLPFIKQFGFDLFLGQIDYQLSVLHYISIGNITALIVDDSNFDCLSNQQGSVGLLQPHNVHQNTIKLRDNNIFIVATDGITAHALKNLNNKYESTKEYVDELSNCVKKNDDALALIMKYNVKNSPFIEKQTADSQPLHNHSIDIKLREPRRKATNKPNLPPITLNEKSLPAQNQPRNTTNINSKPPPNFTTPFDDNDLICSLSEHKLIRQRFIIIGDFLGLPDSILKKVEFIVLEALQQAEANCLNIFFSDNCLKLVINTSQAFYDQTRHLVSESFYYYDPLENHVIILMPPNKPINTDSQHYLSFSQQLKLGLDDDVFVQYQQDRQQEVLLSQQTKLAAMGEMIGAIAHQWRQPINELAIRIQALQYKLKNAESQSEILTDFVTESMNTIHFMSQTIDDFRNFFKEGVRAETFDIKLAIDSALKLQSGQLSSNNIDVTVNGSSYDLTSIRSAFQQVIMNLISNARDALVSNQIEKKQITIDIKPNQILIWDNAGGIEPKNIDRVFEPYFTTKDPDKGTGLGLYIAKRIVNEKMNGELTVVNVKVKNQIGAQFSLTW